MLGAKLIKPFSFCPSMLVVSDVASLGMFDVSDVAPLGTVAAEPPKVQRTTFPL